VRRYQCRVRIVVAHCWKPVLNEAVASPARAEYRRSSYNIAVILDWLRLQRGSRYCEVLPSTFGRPVPGVCRVFHTPQMCACEIILGDVGSAFTGTRHNRRLVCNPRRTPTRKHPWHGSITHPVAPRSSHSTGRIEPDLVRPRAVHASGSVTSSSSTLLCLPTWSVGRSVDHAIKLD
jgi:hypothetical protein